MVVHGTIQAVHGKLPFLQRDKLLGWFNLFQRNKQSSQKNKQAKRIRNGTSRTLVRLVTHLVAVASLLPNWNYTLMKRVVHSWNSVENMGNVAL